MIQQDDINKWYWLTKDNERVLMVNMSNRWLQTAHTHACLKELEYHKLCNKFNELRDQLETIAELRKVELKYPDQRFPHKSYSNFFCNMRKVKNMIPTPINLIEESKKGNLKQESSLSNQS